MLIGFHFGTCATVYAIRSVVSRIDGPGGNAYAPRLRYSLTMSFWVVPVVAPTPRPAPRRRLVEREQPIAVALMVIDVFIPASGMPSNSARISPR